MVFGLTQFHEYMYGQQVIAETDHKPLIAIAKKDFYEMSPRMPHIMMRLQRYDLTHKCKPGPKLVLIGVLSRSYL